MDQTKLDTTLESLKPDHLKIDELKQEPPAQEQKPQPKADPKQERRYTFQLDWKDRRGRVWKGEFVNEVPDIQTRQMIGVLRAKLSGGMPQDALDITTSDINLMVSHLTYTLVTRPDWAKDLQALTDLSLLQAIFEEVMAHEAAFHGLGADQAESAG